MSCVDVASCRRRDRRSATSGACLRSSSPSVPFVFAPMSVVVKADSKYKTLGDLIQAAKSEANRVTYGTGGAGTTPHFVSEALGIAAGVNFMHIPYKGAGEATLGMLSGTIDFQVASTPGVMGNVKGGKARILAISGNKRLTALPDVPTFEEAGVKNFGLINFTGLWAPKGTPPAVIDRLQKEIAVAMATPDMKAFAESIASEPGYWDAAAFRKRPGRSAPPIGERLQRTRPSSRQ